MTRRPTPQDVTAHPTRRVGVDALRGLAVILMLQQHLVVWLWRYPVNRLRAAFPEHPFVVGLNSLGGLAAPVFVALAGVGVTLLAAGTELPSRPLCARPTSAVDRIAGSADRRLVSRGCVVLLLGYALNLLTPFWFSPGSWYVLHVIGLCLVLSPLLRRMSDRWLIVVFVATLATAVLLQHLLETPPVLGNRRMRDLSLAGGHLRLALVEGHFPVFPWLAFFVAGLLTGRRLLDGRMRRVAATACIALALAVALALAGSVGGEDLRASVLWPAVALSWRLYPLRLPTLLALMSAVLFGVWLFARLEDTESPGPPPARRWRLCAPLVSLGRTSLSLFVFHVVVFKQLSFTFGLYKRLGAAPALAWAAAIMAVLTAFSWWWGRHGYTYGVEWLVRRADKIARRRK
jgi:uncharacterized membrane protein